MTITGAEEILTVTLPDAVPDADGVVGVVGVVPVVGVVGVVLAPTPTLAVTVAVCAVVSVDDATPAALVLAILELSVPAVVVNVTGTPVIYHEHDAPSRQGISALTKLALRFRGIEVEQDADAARQSVGHGDFRSTMASVCAPVSVVTAMDGERPHGTTVSAFSSLSP